MQQWPQWLGPLLGTRFFEQCQLHGDAGAHRRECNMFCLECAVDGGGAALCPLCVAGHRCHRIIQIRKVSYHDAVKVSEIKMLLDVGGVQTYITNGARLVFLNERPQLRSTLRIRSPATTCCFCGRPIVDSRFCSLACKRSGSSMDEGGKKRGLELESEEKSSTSEKSDEAGSLTASRASSSRRKGIPHRAPFGSFTVEF